MVSTHYIVSGSMRSGTSAMMGALEAGGLPCEYDLERAPDAINPRGYFELCRERFNDPEVVNKYPGKAIKIGIEELGEKMSRARGESYHIILMYRDPVEVIQSMSSALSNHKYEEPLQVIENYISASFAVGAQFGAAEIAGRIFGKRSQNIRRTIIDFSGLVSEPLEVFREARDVANIPIDPDRAASFIDPSLYRVRCNAAAG